MKIKQYLTLAVMISGLFASVSSFAAYNFKQTDGRLYNYSKQEIVGWKVTGSCTFTPMGFEKSPRSCGEAQAKIAVYNDGFYTIGAFQIPDDHRGSGRLLFSLTVEVVAKDGTRGTFRIYNDRQRLEEGAKALFLFGSESSGPSFLLREESPDSTYLE